MGEVAWGKQSAEAKGFRIDTSLGYIVRKTLSQNPEWEGKKNQGDAEL